MKKLLILSFVGISLFSMQPPMSSPLKGKLPGRNYDQKKQNAFVAAIRQGNYEQVKQLLRFRPQVSLTGLDNQNNNPLEVAVLRGDHKIAELFLELGADPNTRTTGGLALGRPVIVEAVSKGDIGMVELLVRYGATIDLVQKDKVQAIHIEKKLIDYVPRNHPNAKRIKALLEKTKIR